MLNLFCPLKDGQNSVRKVVDTSGSVVASYDYAAFGEVLNSDQPAGWIFNHRAFGEVYDPNLEMTYLRARWMDPGTGRFESRDPLESGRFVRATDLHAYLYVEVNPINLGDPSSKSPYYEPNGTAVDITGIKSNGLLAGIKGDALLTIDAPHGSNLRGLTSDEELQASIMFGNSLKYSQIKIALHHWTLDVNGDRAWTSGYTIHINNVIDQETLIHELTHSWQSDHYGSTSASYFGEAALEQVVEGGTDAYVIHYKLGMEFIDYDVEEQAMIVQLLWKNTPLPGWDKQDVDTWIDTLKFPQKYNLR